jgi:ABC-2 type transport system permease protein
MDMSEGIIARFRTMGISRASLLTGHVLGSTIQTILGLAVVFGRLRSSSASPWRSVSDRMPFRSNGSRRSGCLR